ncbi:hypothetical protein PsorP6_012647 [Peronosclerospora sorghi]|uniref:Uncharacterized protein n=1 Tax=Peronosclerospora sorghi TaxID=230839 RepID=A0ACC0WF56_9STRA|nr:hypothetical protein PsorP6_012647 [Peronosclerospora sorghi]
MAKDVHRVANSYTFDDSKFVSLVKGEATRAASNILDQGKSVFPLRTGLVAISLFILGLVLIYVSTHVGLDEENRGVSIFILGLIAFVPGSYATCQLYGAWKGWKGYHYSQIPSFDD